MKSFSFFAPFSWRRPFLRLAVPLMAAGLVSACSVIPDAANPVTWFSDDEATAKIEVDEAAGDDALAGETPEGSDPVPEDAAASEEKAIGEGEGPSLAEEPAASENEAGGSADATGGMGAPRYEDDSDVVAAEEQALVEGRANAAAGPSTDAAGSFPSMGPSTGGAEAERNRGAPPAPRAAPGLEAPRSDVVTLGAASQQLESTYEQMLAETDPALPSMPARMGGAVLEGAGKAETEIAALSGGRGLGPYRATASRSIQVAVINFGSGSASLSAADRSVLREVVALYKETGGTLRVIGHASSRTRNLDPVGHELVNFDISVKRADAVGNALRQMGVAGDRLYVGAKSDSEPIYYEFMPAGDLGNQRVEIFLDY